MISPIFETMYSYFPSRSLYYDYFFSKYPAIWGWATWRDRWEKYDVNPSILFDVNEKFTLRTLLQKNEFKQFTKRLKNAITGKVNTWDYQWKLTTHLQGFHTIIPKYNLIQNIGFGEEATNTKKTQKIENKSFSISSLENPPKFLVLNPVFEKKISGNKNFYEKLLKKIKFN